MKTADKKTKFLTQKVFSDLEFYLEPRRKHKFCGLFACLV